MFIVVFSDEYGFVNKFACSRETYFLFREKYRERREGMDRQWKGLVTNRIQAGSVGCFKFEPFGPAVKKAIRGGIPSQLRPMAWYFYSGGEALRSKHPNPTAFYESFLLQPKPSAFFLLTDRMKMDFRDILPTNHLVRKDYFSSSNPMINEVPDIGRVRIIPDRTDSPAATRRMTIFDKTVESEQVELSNNNNSNSNDNNNNSLENNNLRPFNLTPTPTTMNNNIPFMSKLYNVLVSFFLFRPSVEYCRAVSTIAAILLLVIQDEEKTFWTLSALFSNYCGNDEVSFESPGSETISFHDFRTDDSLESDQVIDQTNNKTKNKETKVEVNVNSKTSFKYFPDSLYKNATSCGYASIDGFKSILSKKKSTLALNLESLDIPVALLTTTWFQSLFIDVLPTEASMRVLDAFIGEGFKVLYRVALALFYINETELMQKIKGRTGPPNTQGFFENLLGLSTASLTSSSPSPPPSQRANPQVILNFIKFMPKKQVDPDALLDVAFNKIGSLPMSTILAECRRASDVEKPLLQSIRRFSQTPETKLSMETIRRVSTAQL